MKEKVYLQITSGRGPAECCRVVALVLERIVKQAQARGLKVEMIEREVGPVNHTLLSAVISLQGAACDEVVDEWEGTVQWIAQSPYRIYHKRKNWFIDFSPCTVAQSEKFDAEQVVFETFRSGGKGGQNVNKVETGVRAIYLPAGIAVVCTEERSQHANKQKAVARLREIISQSNQQKKAAEKNDNWRCHTSLERGNAGVQFEGMSFKRI